MNILIQRSVEPSGEDAKPRGSLRNFFPHETDVLQIFLLTLNRETLVLSSIRMTQYSVVQIFVGCCSFRARCLETVKKKR